MASTIATVVSLVQYSVWAYEWIYRPFFASKPSAPIQLVVPVNFGNLWNSAPKEPIKKSQTRTKDDIEYQDNKALAFDLLKIRNGHFNAPKFQQTRTGKKIIRRRRNSI